jgi:hypothetical protein
MSPDVIYFLGLGVFRAFLFSLPLSVFLLHRGISVLERWRISGPIYLALGAPGLLGMIFSELHYRDFSKEFDPNFFVLMNSSLICFVVFCFLYTHGARSASKRRLEQKTSTKKDR